MFSISKENRGSSRPLEENGNSSHMEENPRWPCTISRPTFPILPPTRYTFFYLGQIEVGAEYVCITATTSISTIPERSRRLSGRIPKAFGKSLEMSCH